MIEMYQKLIKTNTSANPGFNSFAAKLIENNNLAAIEDYPCVIIYNLFLENQEFIQQFCSAVSDNNIIGNL